MENEQNNLPDSQLYAWILESKRHEETRRDEISKYYTSLFTGIMVIMPIIEKWIEHPEKLTQNKDYLYVVLMIFCTLGMVISAGWMLALKRIYNYVEGFDQLLSRIEKKYDKSFVNYMSSYLSDVNSPARVTQQAMLLPITFCLLFLGTWFYYFMLLFAN